MKDSLLFEHVLAELLRCRDDGFDERDQREAIVASVVQLQLELESSEKGKASLHDTAVDRIGRLENIKKAARNLLGAGDDATWKRFRQALVDAIEVDHA